MQKKTEHSSFIKPKPSKFSHNIITYSNRRYN